MHMSEVKICEIHLHMLSESEIERAFLLSQGDRKFLLTMLYAKEFSRFTDITKRIEKNGYAYNYKNCLLKTRRDLTGTRTDPLLHHSLNPGLLWRAGKVQKKNNNHWSKFRMYFLSSP